MRYIKIEDLLVFRSRWGQGNELWKNSVLKKDFRDFFHNKCWYTEVPLVGQDVHIDHFRPKAAVKPFENFKHKFYIRFLIIRMNTILSNILKYRKTLILPRIYHD